MKKNNYLKSSTGLVKIKSLLCAFLLLMTFGSVNAQVATKYTYSQPALGTWAALATGTTLCSGTGAGTSATWYQGGAAGVAGAGIPLGFSFVYNCQTYSTIGVSTNGYIWFGSGAPAVGNQYAPAADATVNMGGTGIIDGKIAAWACNGAGNAASLRPGQAGSYIRYNSTGGVFTVEWGSGYKINGFASGGGGEPAFQIKLYQTTNVAEVWVHDQNAINVTSLNDRGQVGLCGANNTDYSLINITSSNNTWTAAAPVTSGNNLAYCGMNGTTYCHPGTAAQARIYRWTLTGSCCTPPTTQATGMNFSALTTSSVQVNWTNGNGASRVVVAHATTAVSASPVTGTDYSAGANNAFGSGINLGTSNFVVYAGVGSSVNVTNLTPGTTYFFSVFEASATFCYTAGLSGSQAIPTCFPPSTAASGASISPNGSTTQTINWTRGNGDAVIVVARLTSTGNIAPVNGTAYNTPNTTFGGAGSTTGANNFVVYNGIGTSVTVNGLTPSTSYTYTVYEFVSATSCYAGGATTSGTTLPCQPALTDATSLVFSNITNNAVTATFTRGSGTNVLVVARLTATTRVQPNYAASFTANTVFGSGSITGTGNFTVLNGTANTVTVTNLANAAAYSFDVYEYNASPNCYTTTPLSAGTSTLDGTTSGGCAASVVRTTGSGAYTAIAPATVITSGGQTTGYYQGGAISTPGAGLPIGFNFVYNGTTYSTFGLGVNGYIWFGSGVPSPTATYPIGNASANLGGSGTINGIICAAGIYLENANNASVRNIGYTLSGSTPNRVLKIQWQGYSMQAGYSCCNQVSCNGIANYLDGNRMDFQIILNEDGGTNSNKIGIAYATMGPYCVYETGSSTIAQIGLRGANNTDFTNRGGTMNFSGTDWGANAGAVNSATYNIGLSGNYINTNSLMTFTQAVTTGPTVNGFASGGTASNSCPATTVLLTAGTGFGSYQWFFNGSIIGGPGSNSSTYTATASGSYTVVGKNGACYLSSNAFTVTINSCGVAPAITTCGSSVPQGNDAGLCSAIVNYSNATASGIPAPTVTYSQNSGTSFPVGTTTVTATATNASGTAACQFDVIVNDTEVPTFTCPADVTTCSATPSLGTPTNITDNCAGTVNVSNNATPPFAVGNTTVVWTATDAAGNTATCNQLVTRSAQPTASTTGSATICETGSYTLTAGEASAPIGTIAWTENGAGSITSGDNTLTPTYTSNSGDAGNAVILTMTVSNAPCTDATATYTVNVNAQSIAGILTPSHPTGNVCTGASVSATAAPGSGGAGTIADILEKSINGGAYTSYVSGTPIPTSGLTSVSIRTYRTASGNGCTQSAYNIISWTVVSAPITGSITSIKDFTTGVPVTAVCNGDILHVKAEGTISGPGLAYLWTKGSSSGPLQFSLDGTAGTFVNSLETPTNDVYIQFQNIAGSGYSFYKPNVKGKTFCAASNAYGISVRGTLSGPPTLTGPAIVCPSTSPSYTCGTSTAATQYIWTLTGTGVTGTTFTNQGSTTTGVNLPAAFVNGQLCVTAQLPCGAPSASPPKCMTITTSVGALGNITGATSACPGSTLTYSIPAVSGPGMTYSWAVPAGVTPAAPTGNSVSLTFPNPYTGNPQICVTASTGCTPPSTATKCINVATKTPTTPGNIAGPTANVCAPAGAVNYSVPSQGSSTFNWTYPTNGGGTATATGQNNTFSFTAPAPPFSSGLVSVVAVNPTCTTGGNSPAKVISIKGVPATPASISGPPGGPCIGGNLFTAVYNPAVSGVTYTWGTSLGASAIEPPNPSTSNIAVINWPAGTATYTVNVTASNPCGPSGTRVASFTGSNSECRIAGTGTDETTNVSVYPNPAHDMLTVSIDAIESNSYRLTLTDVAGRAIISESISATAGSNNFDLDLSGLSKGIYILQVQSVNDNWKTKVVVE